MALERAIPERESLTVEFKSDQRRLSDAELVAAAVCLANTDGGAIYLGVEDDGTITGLHAEHRNLSGLLAIIANRTNPPLSVRATTLLEADTPVACIEVPRSLRPVATSDGLLQRRRLQADGTPQCQPFYPHEFAGRQSDLGLLDYSALPVVGANKADFDPRYVELKGKITRQEVVTLCRVSADRAKRLLDRLTRRQILRRVGNSRATYYIFIVTDVDGSLTE